MILQIQGREFNTSHLSYTNIQNMFYGFPEAFKIVCYLQCIHNEFLSVIVLQHMTCPLCRRDIRVS